jgi:DNA adenine methylase
MGSKNRHAKEMLPIILKNRREGQFYVEPFVGGANMIDKVPGNRKIGADVNRYLISLLAAVRDGWEPPEFVSELEYKSAKSSEDEVYKAFVGFLCSFGSKWFGGYARNKVGTNYAKTGRNALLKQAPHLKDIDFVCSTYDELLIPDGSIIYCDPPYAGTTKYGTGGFDHDKFWEWCEYKSIQGHDVYVSEYSAPDHWECVWQKNVSANFDSNRNNASERTEKLFKLTV